MVRLLIDRYLATNTSATMSSRDGLLKRTTMEKAQVWIIRHRLLKVGCLVKEPFRRIYISSCTLDFGFFYETLSS
jgi:hypothetical protein